jgi:hypothetical protein
MLIHCGHTCIAGTCGSYTTLLLFARQISSYNGSVISLRRLFYHRTTSTTTEINPTMFSLPIRKPRDASGTDESNSGSLPVLDRYTDHQEAPVQDSPRSSSPSDTSQDHDHEHTADVQSEPPSDPPDHVSEGSGSEHMNWYPTSPPNSVAGRSGSSSDEEADTDVNTTAETLPETTSLLPLPKSSPCLLTHAHQQAMANRIIYDQILPGGELDPSLYTPVFLHDTLMLPGSLATVIGKVSCPVLITFP